MPLLDVSRQRIERDLLLAPYLSDKPVLLRKREEERNMSIYGLAAIAAVMALSGAFGWAMRGLVDKAVKGLPEATEDPYKDDNWEDDIS